MGFSKMTIAFGAAALALSANASVLSSDFHAIFKRDPPTKLPSCATDADKRWQPGVSSRREPTLTHEGAQQWTSTKTGATTAPRSTGQGT
ncbi:hypothetical protein NUW58_g1444 [Xylaria curta]|uniref:Uncharacterized protein n=1 Tax=Xylaria curta TaxID=42375 RepID=A0ACC1PLJ7_9PEZI|nr:hypothetical protein NUW58_g1444 [Xylaria curta]